MTSYIKIGNTTIDINNSKKENILSVELSKKDEIIKIFNNETKNSSKLIICSTNKKFFNDNLLQLILNREVIFNKFIDNLIDYSLVDKRQLGIDINYSLEYLAKKKNNFKYFSFGTFYVFCEIKNLKLVRLEIFNSVFNELKYIKDNSDIKFDFKKTINNDSEKTINNESSLYYGIIKNKKNIIKQNISKDESIFYSGSESHFYKEELNSSTMIPNIEIKFMKDFFI